MSAHELEPALDISGWLPFEGLCPGKLSFGSVELALNRLRQPTLIEDRLSVLQHIVNYWHGPIRSADGMTDAELAGSCVPAALRWVSLGGSAGGNNEPTKFFAGAAQQTWAAVHAA